MPLRVLSAGSTLHGLRAFAARAAGVELAIATDHGHAIHAAIRAGTAQADVVLLPVEMMDELIAQGLVREPVALGTVAIGGVIRTGASAPAIGTMKELHAALLAADAVLLTKAPSGDHLMQVIADLGIADTLAPRLQRFATSQQLLAQLAKRDDSALGFSPETEIRAAGGVVWIGELPPEIQIALPYAAAMLTGTTQPGAVRALLGTLAAAPAREAFARSGVR